MELTIVDKKNYKEAIKIQNSIFPNEDGTINILASLDRELFMKKTGIEYIDDHIKYYLARVDGEYVGITGIYSYNFDKNSAWIGWYGILKEHRQKGLGKELLTKTSELARSQGFKYLRLYTDYIENKPAINLYKKTGFKGEKYTSEKLAYDCRIYSKSLIDEFVPLWNNRYLGLSHQSELDQMNDKQIKKILAMYDTLLSTNK